MNFSPSTMHLGTSTGCKPTDLELDILVCAHLTAKTPIYPSLNTLG